MWLLTSFVAAVLATALAYYFKSKHKLGFLSLMLWGGTVMILTDHILGYEGGAFLEIQTEGLITSSTMLGLAMLVPVLLVWGISMLMPKLRLGN
ncbi:MAG: hypothetical protein KBD24_03810 [Candidatus Pacebacteria bacterium]|nr:hypothetical protein [Candidatus Paceibacterota bacterium]